MPIVTQNRIPVAARNTDWKAQLKQAYRSPESLLEALELPPHLLDDIEASQRQFPLFCTAAFLNRMQPGDPFDPLFRQVWPAAEEASSLGGNPNPLQEDRFQLRPGLLQKYPNRALMVLTGACAIHCRYCFRRFFPYELSPKSMEQWEPALQSIENDSSIDELILSGGDPMMVVDALLEPLLGRLDAIPHLKRIRCHSRLPVVLPQRITSQFLESIQKLQTTFVFVIHANHANELDREVEGRAE